MPKICVLSTSPGRDSRSRKAALYVVSQLEALPNVEVTFIDLHTTPFELYPTKLDDTQTALVKSFQEADAWVMTGAVYNGGPSAHIINFFHFALDSDSIRVGRPFFLVGSAGGNGSLFAFDALGARVRREVKAIEVGTAVMVTNNTEENESRLSAQLNLLLPYAEVYQSLNSK